MKAKLLQPSVVTLELRWYHIPNMNCLHPAPTTTPPTLQLSTPLRTNANNYIVIVNPKLGQISQIQISTKLHLGYSCDWHLWPILEFNYCCPRFNAHWEWAPREQDHKAGPHTPARNPDWVNIWTALGLTEPPGSSKFKCPGCSMGGNFPQQAVPSPRPSILSHLVLDAGLFFIYLFTWFFEGEKETTKLFTRF